MVHGFTIASHFDVYKVQGMVLGNQRIVFRIRRSRLNHAMTQNAHTGYLVQLSSFSGCVVLTSTVPLPTVVVVVVVVASIT